MSKFTNHIAPNPHPAASGIGTVLMILLLGLAAELDSKPLILLLRILSGISFLYALASFWAFLREL